jgi:superfamily II DNA or RNA helicase
MRISPPPKEIRSKIWQPCTFDRSRRKYYKRPLLKELSINRTKLRKHQYQAVFQLNKNISRDCLLDQPMGSGKTRAVLAFLGPLRSKTLFLTLAPIVQHIKREVARVYTPEQRKTIQVLSYTSFLKKTYKCQCIILDEIHCLPSMTKTKKAILSHKCRFIGLTGTTVINHLSLAAQLRCLPRPTHIRINCPIPQPYILDIHLTVPRGLLKKSYPTSTLDKLRKITQIRKVLSLAKVDIMLTVLRGLSEKLKIVICSEFVATLQALVTPRSILIRSTKDIALLESFRTNDRVLLCTRASINSGVDLGFVDLFFLMEPVAKVHHETQLLARTTRLSQQPMNYDRTRIYRLRYLASLEDRLFQATHNLKNLEIP